MAELFATRIIEETLLASKGKGCSDAGHRLTTSWPMLITSWTKVGQALISCWTFDAHLVYTEESATRGWELARVRKSVVQWKARWKRRGAISTRSFSKQSYYFPFVHVCFSLSQMYQPYSRVQSKIPEGSQFAATRIYHNIVWQAGKSLVILDRRNGHLAGRFVWRCDNCCRAWLIVRGLTLWPLLLLLDTFSPFSHRPFCKGSRRYQTIRTTH